MLINKFPGRCNNPNCPEKCNRYNGVDTGKGFVQKTPSGWVTWCKACVPERIAPQVQARRELTADGCAIAPFDENDLVLFRSFPGARFDKEHNPPCWRVSLAGCDRTRVLEIADRLSLAVAPELRKVAMHPRCEAAKIAGAFPFQIEGIDFLAKGNRRLLEDEMGLGKTIQALLALPEGGRAIVVCPASLKYNWRDECKKWRPDYTPVVVNGKGNFACPKANELAIVNYDILPEWLDPIKGSDGKKSPAVVSDEIRKSLSETVVVADEAHRAKNYKTKRAARLRELCKLSKAVWGLTGTPLMTRPGDLFGILDSLDMVRDVFGSWTKFTSLYGAIKDRWGGYRWGTPSTEVPERLRRVALRRTRQEVLPDLPCKTYTDISVNGMTANLSRRLDRLEEEWGDLIELGQLPPFEEFSAIRAELATSRIDAMVEYVEDCEEQDVPLIVASVHRAPVDALATREGWATITGDTKPEDRQDVVRRFQAGELKGVGLTIQAGGVGLTLTRAWRMLFVDLDWTPANNAQCEDRICRIGQISDKVEIVRMVSDHVLDRHINRLIARKIAMIQASIEAVSETAQTVTNRRIIDCLKTMLPQEFVAPWALSDVDLVPWIALADYLEEQGDEVGLKIRLGLQSTVPAPVRTQGETEVEFEDRMAKLRAGEEERRVKDSRSQQREASDRAQRVRDREMNRANGTGRALLELTSERIEVVREAFRFMLGVCDGAVTRDGQGFNRPDAMIAHLILPSGLGETHEVEAAYWMLTRYRRQLANRFPLLFGGIA